MQALLETLQKLGLELITHNCEYASSQFEINYKAAVGVAAADQLHLQERGQGGDAPGGYLATFMSKPFAGGAGSGCHVHMSLLDKKTGKNAFLDPKDPDGLSAVARSFIAGLVKHAQAMMPLIGPTPNCYHRLKPHTFAPSNISWGIEDRTALVRVKATKDQNTHIEMRGASAVSNPYLSRRRRAGRGPARREGEGEARPRDERERAERGGRQAGEAAEDPRGRARRAGGRQDDARLLGEDFVKLFGVVKRYELGRFRGHVTDWEEERVPGGALSDAW